MAVQVALAGWVRDLAFKDRDKHAYNGPIDPLGHGADAVRTSSGKRPASRTSCISYGSRRPRRRPDPARPPQVRENLEWPIFPTTVQAQHHRRVLHRGREGQSEAAGDRWDLATSHSRAATPRRATSSARHRVSEIILPEAEATGADRRRGRQDGLSVGQRSSWAGGTRCSITSTTSCRAPASTRPMSYSQGLFQEIQALAGHPHRAASQLASKVIRRRRRGQPRLRLGLGYGQASGRPTGTRRNHGSPTGAPLRGARPYSASPGRGRTVYAKIWNKAVAGRPRHRQDSGKEVRARRQDRIGHYWGHQFATVAFKADLPALGYKVYAVDASLIRPPVPAPR